MHQHPIYTSPRSGSSNRSKQSDHPGLLVLMVVIASFAAGLIPLLGMSLLNTETTTLPHAAGMWQPLGEAD